MRIKEGFILREVSGMNIVMPSGSNVRDFKAAVLLNESGVLIFKLLQQGSVAITELVKVLTDTYDVDEKAALADVKEAISSFQEIGILEG